MTEVEPQPKQGFKERMNARIAAETERQEAAQMRKIAGGLTITDGQIAYKGEGGPIAGCRAMVETEGQVRARFTATRIATLGVFGLKKKKIDERELYLTVEGNGFAFVAEIKPKYGGEARKIAAKINALGQVPASVLADAAPVQAASVEAAPVASTADEIAKLAQLHASGVLTDDEFSAAKARLLA